MQKITKMEKEYSQEEKEDIKNRLLKAADWMEENDTNFMLNGLGSQGFTEAPEGFTRYAFDKFVKENYPEAVGSLTSSWLHPDNSIEVNKQFEKYWLDFGLCNHDTYRKFLKIRTAFIRDFANKL